MTDPTGHSYTLDDFYSTSHNGNPVPEAPEDYEGLTKNHPTKHPTPDETDHPGYREINEGDQQCIYVNCYMYAFGLSYNFGSYYDSPGEYAFNVNRGGPWYNDLEHKGKCSLEELKEMVLLDMEAYGIQCRDTTDTDVQLKDNEYIVAMKTSNIENNNGHYDFHFAYQTGDGLWADKQGGYPTRIGVIDGTAAVWDSRPGDNYYNSLGTVYFIVTR